MLCKGGREGGREKLTEDAEVRLVLDLFVDVKLGR